MLGVWAQDIGPNLPDTLIVVLRRGGHVSLASIAPKAKIAQIAACEEVWKESERSAGKLFAEYEAKGFQDEKLFDRYTAEQTRGDAAFRACFSERAPREGFFPALTRQAQELADRLAAP
jgi:hypothetical protein